MLCKYCNRLCNTKCSLTQHQIRCKLNPERIKCKPSYGMLGKTGSNQHIKAKREGKDKIIVSTETREKLRIANTGLKWSDERRQKHSIIMLNAVKNNPDSYSTKNVSGRVKNYEYNGNVFKGSWELKTAKALDKAGIPFTNIIDKPFEYIWNENIHLYFPDFYLPTYDLYIEVKGFKRDRDIKKWEVVKNLKIFGSTEIKLLDNLCIKKLLE